jgi:hypothetical protein
MRRAQVRVVRKVLAFFGWIDHTVMEARSSDNDRAYGRGGIASFCCVVLLFAAGGVYLAVNAATTAWVPASVSQVASGELLRGGTVHVLVTGRLDSLGIKFSCDEWGMDCFYVSALTDDSGNVIYVVVGAGEPTESRDGTATVKGVVTAGPVSEQALGAALAQARDSYPDLVPTSKIFVDGRKLNDQPLFGVVVALLLICFASLLALAYKMGIIPFDPSPDRPNPSITIDPEKLMDLPCGVTGTLKTPIGHWASFRDRTARLSIDQSGMMLVMSRWWPRHPTHPRSYVPGTPAFLLPANLKGDSHPGKAYLVFSTKLAIKLATERGAVLLTFARSSDRDAVLARLGSWDRA